jgi:hypothetical protein
MNANQELSYLYEALPLLDQYLGSKDGIWQLPGIAKDPGISFSILTIGVVLFILKRVKTRSLPEKLTTERGDFETRIFQSKIHNEHLWMKKVGQDLSARMRLWQTYLEEYQNDPVAGKASYPNQVSQRVIIQLLNEEQDTGSLLLVPLQFMLQTMDAILKNAFVPGDFIWENELASGFSKDTYWYLYGSVK